jgi:hypothetical protein
VELYNPLASEVMVDGWTMEYKSATGVSWSKKATLTGSIKGRGFYLLAPSAYLPTADKSFAGGLSGTAGHLRIKDKDGTVIDTLGWGIAADSPEGLPASAPAVGQSLERLPGRLLEDGGNSTDTQDNSKDFIIRQSPLPQSTSVAVEIPKTEIPAPADPISPIDPPADPGQDEAGPLEQEYLPILITELLPDPASPLTDSSDEFVEFFNPNAVDVDLKGYTLQAGSGFHDYYIFDTQIIKAGEYLSAPSALTRVSLTNNGGAAQLLDPAGRVVSKTNAYPLAFTGLGWNLVEGSWAWSLQLTPAADNVLVAPLVKEVVSAKPKVTTLTKKAVAQTAPKASKTVKAAAPKTPKAAKETKPKTTKPLLAAAKKGSNSWLMILVGVLTLGLLSYEFRYDLQNYYKLARRKFGSWRKARPTS